MALPVRKIPFSIYVVDEPFQSFTHECAHGPIMSTWREPGGERGNATQLFVSLVEPAALSFISGFYILSLFYIYFPSSRQVARYSPLGRLTQPLFVSSSDEKIAGAGRWKIDRWMGREETDRHTGAFGGTHRGLGGNRLTSIKTIVRAFPNFVPICGSGGIAFVRIGDNGVYYANISRKSNDHFYNRN